VVRGESIHPPRGLARFAVVLGFSALGALAVPAILLRPWSAERSLYSGPGFVLVIRVRGNALGSHCEVENLTTHVAIDTACGLTARSPEIGGDDVVLDGHGVCVLEPRSMRMLGCTDQYAHWVVSTETAVSIATSGGTWTPRGQPLIVHRFDRGSGAVTRTAAAPGYQAADAWRESVTVSTAAD
jgi:hypothetical protein